MLNFFTLTNICSFSYPVLVVNTTYGCQVHCDIMGGGGMGVDCCFCFVFSIYVLNIQLQFKDHVKVCVDVYIELSDFIWSRKSFFFFDFYIT